MYFILSTTSLSDNISGQYGTYWAAEFFLAISVKNSKMGNNTLESPSWCSRTGGSPTAGARPGLRKASD